jgi:hypothetical protein
MNAQPKPALGPDTQAMLDALQRAVTNALERKRRLGHYAVLWSGSAPMVIGEDAPERLQAPQVTADIPAR